jgi:hypothetical protein
MLTINVVLSEGLDETTNEFVTLESFTLQLEHSLSSLSKWESFYEKPFLSDEKKTPPEAMAYIKYMTLTPDVPDDVFNSLSQKDIDTINDYMNAKMTATWFSERAKKTHDRQIITAEIVFYWMVGLSIPFECQDWHLNRLLTLVRVINEKNAPTKKMGKTEALQEQRRINEQRRAQYGTRG